LHLEHQSERSLADMSVSQMRVEDRLVGASNWSPWKARIVIVLEDLELWDIVEVHVPILPVTAPVLLADFRKRNNKAMRTICDAVRDHIILVFHRDASPRVGDAGDAFPTSPGRGDSKGDVSPRPLFGGTRGNLGGRDSPRWGTKLPKRGTPGRPPLKGGLLDVPPKKGDSWKSPPNFFCPVRLKKKKK
jgi:hypothetical protein